MLFRSTNTLIENIGDIRLGIERKENNNCNMMTVASQIKKIYFQNMLLYLDMTCYLLNHDFGNLRYESYFLEIISSYNISSILIMEFCGFHPDCP